MLATEILRIAAVALVDPTTVRPVSGFSQNGPLFPQTINVPVPKGSCVVITNVIIDSYLLNGVYFPELRQPYSYGDNLEIRWASNGNRLNRDNDDYKRWSGQNFLVADQGILSCVFDGFLSWTNLTVRGFFLPRVALSRLSAMSRIL